MKVQGSPGLLRPCLKKILVIQMSHAFKNLSKKGCSKEFYHKCHLGCTGVERLSGETGDIGVTVFKDVKITEMLRHTVLISQAWKIKAIFWPTGMFLHFSF